MSKTLPPDLLATFASPMRIADDDIPAFAVFRERVGRPTLGQMLLLVEQRAYVRAAVKRLLDAGMTFEFHHAEDEILRPAASTLDAVMALVGVKTEQAVQVYIDSGDGRLTSAGFFRMRHNTISTRVIDHASGAIVPLIYAPEAANDDLGLH